MRVTLKWNPLKYINYWVNILYTSFLYWWVFFLARFLQSYAIDIFDTSRRNFFLADSFIHLYMHFVILRTTALTFHSSLTVNIVAFHVKCRNLVIISIPLLLIFILLLFYALHLHSPKTQQCYHFCFKQLHIF